MKRFFTLALAVLLLLSLTACKVTYSKQSAFLREFTDVDVDIATSHLRVVVESVSGKQVGYDFAGLKEHFKALKVKIRDGVLHVSLNAPDIEVPEEAEPSRLYINLPPEVLEQLTVNLQGELDFICAPSAKVATVTVDHAACQLNQVSDIAYEISNGASVAIEEAETVDVLIRGQSKFTLGTLYAGGLTADADEQSEIRVLDGGTRKLDLNLRGASRFFAETLEFQDGSAVLRDHSNLVLGKLYGDLAYDVDETSDLNVLEVAK